MTVGVDHRYRCAMKRLSNERHRPKILILESEYLIALDAERILKEAFPCDIVICRPDMAQVSTRLKDCDLALVDVGPSPVQSARIARRLCQSGMAVILSCVGRRASRRNVTIIQKPYDEETLVAMVRSRL